MNPIKVCRPARVRGRRSILSLDYLIAQGGARAVASVHDVERCPLLKMVRTP